MNETLSPVMALFQQWEIANAATADGDVSEAEFDARVRRATDLQDRILATPGTSQADFVAKVAAYTAFGRDELATSSMATLLWSEARAIMNAPPSEIARLFADWTAARAALNLRAKDGRFDNEPDPHFEAMMRAEDAMMPIPAKTPADLAMKIYAENTGDVVHRCPEYEPLFLEIQALVGMPEK